jgi:hypothetical protein
MGTTLYFFSDWSLEIFSQIQQFFPELIISPHFICHEIPEEIIFDCVYPSILMSAIIAS